MQNSRYLRTIPLEQHSPLIHFQAGQAAATLRATEVKARLDRFIHQDLREVDHTLYQAYLRLKDDLKQPLIPDATQKKPGASAYRMHISGEAESWYIPVALMARRQQEPTLKAMNARFPQAQGRMTILQRTPYFANADKIKDEKWDEVRVAVMYKDVNLKLTSPFPKLLDFLEKVVPHVLARHNFGTRNNKGFGCFLPASEPHAVLRQIAHTWFDFDTKPGNQVSTFQSLFEYVNLLYSSLRSGINRPDRNGNTIFYFKSMLFLYFRDLGIQWDKKTIKQTYFNRIDQDHLYAHDLGNDPDYPLSFTHTEKKLVRDLLGLASSQTWGRDYRNAIIEKSHVGSEIARAKSPLWFKPVRSRDRKKITVYLGSFPLAQEYLGEEFSIANGRENRLKLSLPENFNIKKFLHFAFNQPLEAHVDAHFHDEKEFDHLMNMYSQLKNNFQ
ncbi:MAG: hypothetical protein D6722_22595 [Bacteroidetes bacterium]|nr:MAG: hypothetical protein D6722_22595 [Bacteroidota bacterium]